MGVLVGRNVAVYLYSGLVSDRNGNNTLGNQVSLLGRFKTITLEYENEFEETTASSAGRKERTFTCDDWHATLEDQIRSGGSIKLNTALNFKYAALSFTEEENGETILLYGGIGKTTYKRDKGEGIATQELMNVGDDISPTGSSIQYA